MVRDDTVGVIGVGDMGGALARSMLRSGLPLVVFDVRPEKVAELVQVGAIAATSIEDVVRQARVVSVVVVTDAQVKDVGREILEHAPAGTIVLVHSTVRPSTIVQLDDLALPKQVHVVDASVNGAHEKAVRGKLTLMIGGDKGAVESCRHVFDAISQHAFYLGPVGSGVVGKLVNNLIALGTYALLLEAMELAHAYGIEEDAIATVVAVSEGDTRGLRTWGRHDRKRLERRADGVDWSERMGRDLEEAVIAAGLREVRLPVTAVIAEGMPSKLRRRDRALDLGPRPSIPRCSVCDWELAAPYRDSRTHPECRGQAPDGPSNRRVTDVTSSSSPTLPADASVSGAHGG